MKIIWSLRVARAAIVTWAHLYMTYTSWSYSGTFIQSSNRMLSLDTHSKYPSSQHCKKRFFVNIRSCVTYEGEFLLCSTKSRFQTLSIQNCSAQTSHTLLWVEIQQKNKICVTLRFILQISTILVTSLQRQSVRIITHRSIIPVPRTHN